MRNGHTRAPIRWIGLLLTMLLAPGLAPSADATEEAGPWTMPQPPVKAAGLEKEEMKVLEADLSRDLSALKTLHCSFHQERHSKLLVRPFRARGMLWHRAPASLRWEVTSPRKSVLFTDGKTVRRFKHFRGKWQEDKLVSSGGLLKALERLSGWLSGKLPAKGARAWRLSGRRLFLRLEPATEELAAYLLSIDILLTGRPYRIVAIQLREKSGDRVVIRMLDHQINATLPENIFTHVQR